MSESVFMFTHRLSEFLGSHCILLDVLFSFYIAINLLAEK